MFDAALTELLDRIDAHCAATGESVTAFGRRAVGDANVIAQIRSGRRSPTVKTLDRLHAALPDWAVEPGETETHATQPPPLDAEAARHGPQEDDGAGADEARIKTVAMSDGTAREDAA